MSLLEVTQNLPASLTVILINEDTGVPRLGLVDADIVVKYAKFGSSSYTTKVLSGTDLHELGNGVYKLNFTAGEFDTLGTFIFVVTSSPSLSPQIRQYVHEILVVVDTGIAPVPVVLPTNKITGTVMESNGLPAVNVPVVATILEVPTILISVGISESVVSARTDANGYFEMDLIQGAKIDINIPNMNFRREFIVPATGTSDLFAIP